MKRLFVIYYLSAATLAQALPFPFMPMGRTEVPGPSEAVIALSGDLNFHLVSTGLVARREFRIEEIGGVSSLQVSGIDYPEGFSGAWSGVVSAGGHADVTVEFAPLAPGAHRGIITVQSDAVSGGNSMACFGVGVPQQIDQDYRTRYELALDQSDDFVDMDEDGYTTMEEWFAGTNPRDASSFFEFSQPDAAAGRGFVVSWPGVEGRSYRLLRSTNLANGFEAIPGEIDGVAPVTTYVDEEDVGEVRFYRVEIVVE